MSHLRSTLVWLLFSLLGVFASAETPVFRFHLLNEPTSLRTVDQKNSGSSYFLGQLNAGLYRYQDQKLEPDLAEKCEWLKKGRLVCHLKKDLKWSDGTPLVAQDFVRAFQELLKPEYGSPRADILFDLKNAEDVYKGKKPASSLGAVAVSKTRLEFQLGKRSDDFLYKLAHPLLIPWPASGQIKKEKVLENPSNWKSSGPYVISAWTPNKKIELANNTHYWKKIPRPKIETLFVQEDSVALNLFEKKELSFLRRLPAAHIPSYRGKPEYREVPQIRMDYVGFHPRHSVKFRQSLARAIDYEEWQKLYQAKEPPGCPGIPVALMDASSCHQTSIRAKKEYDALVTAMKSSGLSEPSLELIYSKQGGDDHQRAMEWLQGNLKKNLGLKVAVTGIENKLFVERITNDPPDMFRKGVAPEIPTCSAALEVFTSGHPENYIRLKEPKFDQMVEKMRSATSKDRKKLCGNALSYLIGEALIIPTGPIYFTILVRPEWTGVRLNELNHLDLSELQRLQ